MKLLQTLKTVGSYKFFEIRFDATIGNFNFSCRLVSTDRQIPGSDSLNW